MLTLASWTGSSSAGPYLRLCGEVEHHLGTIPFEQRREAVGAHVHVEERELLAVPPCLDEVGDPARREVVDRHHPVAFGEESLRQLRADEPGAPGHQDGRHGANLRFGSAPMSSEDRSPRAEAAPPTAAIIAALSVQSSSGGNRIRRPARAPSSAIRSRSLVFATTPPPSRTVDAALLRRGHGLGHLDVDDRFLEGGGDVRQGDVVPGGLLGSEVAQDGRLQPAHREVEVSRIRHRPREPDGSRVALGREGVERRAPGESQAEEPRHLVERLAGRVIEGLPEHLVACISAMCTSIVCPPRRRG